MKQKLRSRVNRKKAKAVLRLPDLEHAKAAVVVLRYRSCVSRGFHELSPPSNIAR